MTILPFVLIACAQLGPADPATAHAPADTLVDVDDYALNVEVIRGDRPVAFVLESGGGAELAAWSSVPESIASRTGATVVIYDRAGFGGSELGPADLKPEEQLEDLRAALDALDVPRTRIVGGHSYGGLMAMLHAARHSDEVVGVLLVDAMNPRFVAATGDFVHSTVPRITDPATDTERALARMIASFDALVELVAAEETSIAQPVAVLTAGIPWWGSEDAEKAWLESHESMAAAAPNRWLVVAEDSRHDVPGMRPDAIVDAAVRLLEETAGGD